MGSDILSWGPEFNPQVLQARLSVVRKLSTKFWWLPTKKRGHFELKTPPQGRHSGRGRVGLRSLSFCLGGAEVFFWGSLSIFLGELKYFFWGA